MAGLIFALHSSVRALTAQSRGIETAGKNLANVNNPEYARQRVVFGDLGTVITPTGAEGTGLEALGVRQLRDSLVDRQVAREIAVKSAFEAEQSAYQSAQAGLGQTIDRSQSAASGSASLNTGIAAAIDEFFNAFQNLAARPTDDGERQALLQRSAILVDRLNLADGRLAQVQDDVTAGVADDVSGANTLLHAIADLNKQIARIEVTVSGSAVDLRDQRQARLEELATKFSFESREVNSQTQVVVKDASGGEILLVDGATVPGDVAFDGMQLTGGAPATAMAIVSGSIQGALAARDGAVQALRDDLDRVAQQLVSSVNAAYNPSGATGDFFGAGVTAGTIRLAAGLDTASLKAGVGAVGDNTVALAIGRLASTKFSTAGGDAIDGTFSSFFSRTVSQLGQALAGANARVEDQTSIAQFVRSQRDAISSVSLDEEMGDLMKYQRAFQASSRVFSVVDGLLDTVINGLGHR